MSAMWYEGPLMGRRAHDRFMHYNMKCLRQKYWAV